MKLIVDEEKTVGGQLGRPSGARFRTYERLKQYAEDVKGSLFDTPQLAKVIEEIYRNPLRQSATDMLNRQLRSGISNEKLAELAISLHDEDRLCQHTEEDEAREPRLICSMGLVVSASIIALMSLNLSRTRELLQSFDFGGALRRRTWLVESDRFEAGH